MRICIISNPNSIHTQRWLRYFTDQGHFLYLIAVSTPQQPLVDRVQVIDLASKINIRKIRFPIWAYLVRRYVHNIAPDILHAHQVANAGWLGASSFFHPFMVTAWGSDLLLGPQRSRAQNILAKWVLQKADFVTCVSSSLAQAALLLGADSKKIKVAPWGVDTDIYYPPVSKEVLREKLGYGNGPIILSLRAMKQVYNPLVIAQAIPRVLSKYPTAQFIIRTYNCDQNQLNQFRSIIKNTKADHAVHYIGELTSEESIADLYRVADISISIPSSDGTPSSVLEALACGSALIVSDVPSLHEWIQHGKEGLFIPISDVDALVDTIIQLLNNHPLIENFSYNGIQLIKKKADRMVWMKRAEELYKELV